MPKNPHLSCHCTRHSDMAVSPRKYNYSFIPEDRFSKVAIIQYYVSSYSHKSLKKKKKNQLNTKCSSKTKFFFFFKFLSFQMAKAMAAFRIRVAHSLTSGFPRKFQERGIRRSFQDILLIKQFLCIGNIAGGFFKFFFTFIYF